MSLSAFMSTFLEGLSRLDLSLSLEIYQSVVVNSLQGGLFNFIRAIFFVIVPIIWSSRKDIYRQMEADLVIFCR